MSHVLLLRAPSASDAGDGDGGKSSGGAGGGGKSDPYETQLAPATSVPVYETVQTLDELQWILETGAGFHGYKGVVVTSKRAVGAWAAAAQNVPAPADERAYWTDVPFYVVGAATAAAVQDLRTTLADAAHLLPGEVLGAEEAGTSEALAHFILQHLANARARESLSTANSLASSALNGAGSASTDNLSASETPRPTRRGSRASRHPTKLLFLVGDKTRNVLKDILDTDDNVELDSVQVYETKPAPGFSAALQAAVKARPKVKTWWIAFFAPSSADYALPYLREHFTLPEAGQQQKKKKKGPLAAKIAAIGPTTAAHLKDTLNLDVAAIAAKPGPDELAAAIKEAN